MVKIIIAIIILIVSAPFAYNYYQDQRREDTLEDLESPDRRCVSCDLSGMDLSARDLRGFDFSNSDLTRADLRCSNLSYANLSGTNMRGANITGTILTGARLSRDTVMERVIWDDGTKCR